MTTLIYCRYSSSHQHDGESIERQITLCNQAARLHQLDPVTHVYKDEGKSAFSGANLSGKLGELLHDLEQGIYKGPVTLLVESVDRLSRGEIQDASGLVQRLQQHCTLITVGDNHVYHQGKFDLVGMITLLVKAATAREESEKKSLRSKATHAKAKAEGRHQNTKVKRYLQVAPDKLKANTTVVPEEIPFIRELFRLKRLGYGVRRIQTMQHEFRGDLPPYGRTGLVLLFKDTELVERGIISETDLVMVKVDTPEWNKAGGRRSPKNLFRGIFRCGYCGARIVFKAGSLLCNTKNVGGKAACDFPAISYKKFEPLFLDSLSLFARDLFAHKVVDVEAIKTNKEALETSLIVLDSRIDNIVGALSDMPEQLAKALSPIKAEITAKKTELAEVTKDYEEAVASLETVQLETPTTDEERTAFNLRLTKAVSQLTIHLSKDGQRFLVKGDKSDVGVILDRGLTSWRLYDQPMSKDDDEEITLEFGEEFEGLSQTPEYPEQEQNPAQGHQLPQ